MTNAEMKELLTLAAKACELAVIGTTEHSNARGGFALMTKQGNWNPLTNDGDYSRMEAQLGITVEWGLAGVKVKVIAVGFTYEFYDDHNGDKQAARRAAGTRLAAEIGEMMK